MHTIDKQQFVSAPLENVFGFFQRPDNLDLLTPPWLRFRMLTPQPIQMRPGMILDYRISTRGIPMRWTAVIAEYDPPHRFVDLQLRGPYSFWHHVHAFEPAGSGTVVTDRVRYELPCGPFGRLAHVLFVRRDLERIFDFREGRLRSLQAELSGRNGAPLDVSPPSGSGAAPVDGAIRAR